MDNYKLPDLRELGFLAKKVRKIEGLSQKKLASLVGCSHVSILKLEKGKGGINITTAWRILDVLGMLKNT